MKAIPTSILAGAVMSFSSFACADRLPVLSEEPWLGFWVGYEEREFDFGISGRAEGELMLKDRSQGEMKRISDTRSLAINYLVEEKKGESWQKRTLEVGQIESELAASNELEECSFVATYKGGTKAKISHRFDGDEVFITIEMLETESENPIRLGVEVKVPDLYRLETDIDERELKKKLKGDEVALKTLTGKKVKFDLSDKVNLETEKGLEGGVSEFSIECKNLAERTIVMSSVTDKTGKIIFGQKGAMNEGFSATWYPAPTEEGKPEPELVIEVK
ncbi:MAG: hypothetical protein ACSHYB_19150 [Roseibacillus sp.]